MKYYLVITILIITLVSCGGDAQKEKKTTQQQAPKELKLVATPTFNADSAFAFVQKQVDFGPRTPNSEAHEACKTYLLETFDKLGAAIETQSFEVTAFDGLKMQGTNIIASINPQATRRILLAAHWDSRRFADKDKNKDKRDQAIDGANDGASGVGVLLEVARTLQSSKDPLKNVGVDIILFDLEDDGVPNDYEFDGDDSKTWCHGSQYWSAQKHKDGYAAYFGILLDMVGAPNANFLKEPYSVSYASNVVNGVWAIAQKQGYKSFKNKTIKMPNGYGILDDHFYVNTVGKIPMIDIIDYKDDFGSFHHTHDDNMSIIDKTTLKEVGQTIIQVLYQLDKTGTIN